METLTADILLKRAPELLASPVDEELVMMDIEAGQYYGLNTVAARIWELLETPQSTQSICNQLLIEFEVEREACEKEVMAFLKDLQEKKVVQIDDSKPVSA